MDHHHHHGASGNTEPPAVELSEQFLNHALTPSNVGMIVSPDGQANPSSDCGDNIELYLRVQDSVIIDARFLTEGCLHTMACGSALTSLIKGREVTEAVKLSEEAISDELGGLDDHHLHCATLAKGALTTALTDYFSTCGQPWKKLYQK